MSDIREDRIALFANLARAETQPKFWDRVAENVDWTVEGTQPLAGRYHSKAEFLAATFTRLEGVLVGGRDAGGAAPLRGRRHYDR